MTWSGFLVHPHRCYELLLDPTHWQLVFTNRWIPTLRFSTAGYRAVDVDPASRFRKQEKPTNSEIQKATQHLWDEQQNPLFGMDSLEEALENLYELRFASCPTQDADSSPQGSWYFWVWGSQAKALVATGRKHWWVGVCYEIFTFVEIRKKVSGEPKPMMFKVKNSRGRSFYLYSCHGLFMIYWLQIYYLCIGIRDTPQPRNPYQPFFGTVTGWGNTLIYIYMYLYLYLCFYICTRMSQGEHENSEVPGDRDTGFLWCWFWFDPMYACGKTIFPETNTAPENQWLEDDMSFWDGLFSRAMLRSGSVMVFNLNFGYLNSSQTVESDLWCFQDVRSGITFSEDTPVNQLQNWHPSETPKYSEFQINWELEFGFDEQAENLPVLQNLFKIDFSRK